MLVILARFIFNVHMPNNYNIHTGWRIDYSLQKQKTLDIAEMFDRITENFVKEKTCMV
jgi:hypothetical protein